MRLKNFNLSYGTQIFKSFSDESRTRIIHLLYEKEELRRKPYLDKVELINSTVVFLQQEIEQLIDGPLQF